ncbi:AAA family ATPase [Nocardia farcinica]|uniref:AAA family ATPase n=1 Tax=Nocardia farcinica TaxID=37329 RepID=UPI001E44D357|nr:AAA family ATPase [Nocardia farcinica]UEX23112.1 AAA family ATPase [Nocardia farcinica]
MSPGVLLYGPPASGKDTVTAALSKLDERFRLFQRLKDGPGRTAGYRMVSAEQFDRLAKDGGLVWTNTRYRARYAIDRAELMNMVDSGVIPVVHAGQPAVIAAVTQATPHVSWLVVALCTDRETARTRIEARATGDAAERLAAWDETEPLPSAHLQIDTAVTSPDAAAAAIHAAISR